MGQVGILGGTFNPPHRAHLAIARAARDQLGLECVLLMPASASPFKTAAPDPGPAHRLQMCRLACLGERGIAACGLEIERGGVSFTVDTLRSVHASHPDAELTFILGSDTAATLPQWRDPQGLLRLARLAVAARTGVDREQALRALATIEPRSRPCFLDMPPVDVSASLVRERVAAGEPVAELVGEEVADYIARHALYGDSGSAS